MEQRNDRLRGGINATVDLGKRPVLGSRQIYRVKVERTTVMETDLYGTPVEVIEAAKREAQGNSIVSDERVSVWIPGSEITEPDLAALSDEERSPISPIDQFASEYDETIDPGWA